MGDTSVNEWYFLQLQEKIITKDNWEYAEIK